MSHRQSQKWELTQLRRYRPRSDSQRMSLLRRLLMGQASALTPSEIKAWKIHYSLGRRLYLSREIEKSVITAIRIGRWVSMTSSEGRSNQRARDNQMGERRFATCREVGPGARSAASRQAIKATVEASASREAAMYRAAVAGFGRRAGGA